MPFGFPVLPEVYSINKLSSLSRGSGGQVVDSLAMTYMYMFVTHTKSEVEVRAVGVYHMYACVCVGVVGGRRRVVAN